MATLQAATTLTGAIGAEESEDLPPLNCEVKVVDSDDVTEPFGEPLQFYRTHACTRHCSP